MQLISIDFSQINQSQQKMYFCYNRLYIRFNLNSVKSKYNNSHKKLDMSIPFNSNKLVTKNY